MLLGDDDHSHRLQIATEAAKDAGRLILSYYRRPDVLEAVAKGPRDLVTAADHAADAFLRKRLAATFPDDAFLTEESGGEIGDRLWVIDPIDGTGNFARGLPHFCISVASCVDERPDLGVIYDPVHDELYTARKDRGATCNGRTIAGSRISAPEQSLIDVGYSHRHPSRDYAMLIDRLMVAGCGFCQSGSAALGLAHLADGRRDGYCELHLYSWDVLAGIFLVQEAGGWTSEFPAGDGLIHGNPLLACTPVLTDDLRCLTGI